MKSERGAAAVAMAGIAGVLAVVAIAAASLSVLYTARAQAVLAADAAALAAAPATFPGTSQDTPVTAARQMASANGALLVSCDCRIDASLSDRVVEVRTAVDVSVPVFGRQRIHATSRAEFDPRAWLMP